MRGIVLPGDGEAYVKEWDWEEQAVGLNEVRIQIGAAALCRSDMSLYYGDPLVGGEDSGEVVPGHEPAGTISEIGENVDHLEVSDRVAIDCFVGCGHCEYCLDGEDMLCDDVEILGFDRHGGDAEELITPASTCHKMPDEMSMATGSVSTDAIGNLYSTCKQIGLSASDTVGVVGLGPMGLSGVLNADAFGSDVVVFEPVDERREKGLELGGDYAIDPSEEDPQKEVDAITDGEGLDKVIECSGTVPGIEMALDVVGRHGTVAQLGETHDSEVPVRPSDHLIHKKVDYVGSWYFDKHEWPEIADFIVNKIGNDRAEEIISHKYPLEEEEVQEGFRKFDNRETQKVLFTP